MYNMQKKHSVWYNVSMFLLLWMTGIVVITSVFFLFNVSITLVNFIFPLLITLVLFFYEKKDYSKKECVTTVVCAILLLFLIILFTGISYDRTWDGSAYHRTAIGLLEDGWNPLKQSAEEFVKSQELIDYFTKGPLKWSEAYPKASWYISAVFYNATGNIECGKAYTLIFAVIVFGIFYDFFQKNKYTRWTSTVLGLLTAFNPMVLDQIQSFYIDGMTSCVLMLLILESYEMVNNNLLHIEDNTQQLKMIVMLLILGCNLKFSTFAFCGFICVTCYFFLVFIKKDLGYAIRLLFFYGCGTVFSVGFIGAAPYVTNSLRYGDPLYGFSSMFNGAELEQQFGVVGLGKAGRAIVSLFGKMSHGNYNSLQSILKIPFTYFPDELQYYSYVDLKVSGSGIFFSGIFLLSLIIIIIHLGRKKKNLLDVYLIVNFGLIILELVIFEGTYQIRYVSHIYIICIYAIAICLHSDTNIIMSTKQVFAIVLVTIFILNNIPWLQLIGSRTMDGIRYKNELAVLKEEQSEHQLEIAYFCKDFSGLYFNLKDVGIDDYILCAWPLEGSENWSIALDSWICYH